MIKNISFSKEDTLKQSKEFFNPMFNSEITKADEQVIKGLLNAIKPLDFKNDSVKIIKLVENYLNNNKIIKLLQENGVIDDIE